MKNKFNVIGLMSGTSLDGLDIAHCEYTFAKTWTFKIKEARTIKYPSSLLKQLQSAAFLSAEKLLALDVSFGSYLGKICEQFMNAHSIKPDFISSHGHTIFHQPEKGFTYQIGNGNAIHAITQVPVICDFRSLDVMLGGQGAPLVPVGDKLLFSDYDVCLNLGGIANLSMEKNKARIAFDICFCNMSLNYLMEQSGKRFDRGGQLAATGTVNKNLLQQLTRAYKPLLKKRPSLGRELFEEKFQPILDASKISLQDKLATCVESTSMEICKALDVNKKSSMLCSGGGAYNSYLVSRILNYCGDNVSIIIPDEDILKFKEAMVFGFLGVLRFNSKNNCLKSVTGAIRDNSGGTMIGF